MYFLLAWRSPKNDRRYCLAYANNFQMPNMLNPCMIAKVKCCHSKIFSSLILNAKKSTRTENF
jgi:hypothetical protein